MDATRQIEDLLYEKIPITRAMGVKVESYDGNRLVLVAPLELNSNHMGTAFGGSINTMAILSGYGLLWLEMLDTNCHIVIRKSSISYERPVRGEIRATCIHPGSDVLDAFRKTFRRAGKARVELAATIGTETEVGARFSGTFVALR